MSDLEFIKKSLQYDLSYWEKEKEKEPDNAFYRGAVSSLSSLKEKIEIVLEKLEEK